MSRQIFLILFLLNTASVLSVGSAKKSTSKSKRIASGERVKHSKDFTSKKALSSLITDTPKKGRRINNIVKLPINKGSKQKKKASLKTKHLNTSKTQSKRAAILLLSQVKKEKEPSKKSFGIKAAVQLYIHPKKLLKGLRTTNFERLFERLKM